VTANLSTLNLSRPDQIVVPLMPRDPMADEQFLCLVTPAFAAIALQGKRPDTDRPGVTFSFDPEVLQRFWGALRLRLQKVRPDALDLWDAIPEEYPFLPPHYRVLSHFSNLLMSSAHDRLPSAGIRWEPQLFLMPAATEPQPNATGKAKHHASAVRRTPAASDAPEPVTLSEQELLRAIAHEVQTPLATIRTLTRLLLRRSDLTPMVRKYVKDIERECTEQIDRFGLFFRATELDSNKVNLQSTSLADLLAQNSVRWQEQVERRGSTLELDLPEVMPSVVSDPTTLLTVLTGTIDRLARSASPGSHIRVKLLDAGEQVKLQIQVDAPTEEETLEGEAGAQPQALGQWLVLQPDTGALSLSIPMTQHLFRALGAYLTVRHPARKGEILTIYLPQCPE
jgi:hypothetical protein